MLLRKKIQGGDCLDQFFISYQSITSLPNWNVSWTARIQMTTVYLAANLSSSWVDLFSGKEKRKYSTLSAKSVSFPSPSRPWCLGTRCRPFNLANCKEHHGGIWRNTRNNFLRQRLSLAVLIGNTASNLQQGLRWNLAFYTILTFPVLLFILSHWGKKMSPIKKIQILSYIWNCLHGEES